MNLGYFPTPYPDELLYSICARYGDVVGYANVKSLCLELFGSGNVSAVADFPGRLQYLARSLPANRCYTVEQLIQNHTLFPYYRSFLSPKTAEIIARQMSESNGNGIYLRAGLAASRVGAVGYLRYCSSCVADDVNKYAEAYWHRAHQLPSVVVCHTHRLYLEQSTIKMHCPPHQHQYVPASKAVPGNLNGRPLGDSRIEFLFFKLARISIELLDGNFPAIGKDALLNKYLRLLIQRGLASYSLSLRARKLETEFLQFYPSEFPAEFNCKLTKTGNSTKGNWLLNLLRKHPSSAQHPLHHLLLLLFLECGVADFFDLPEKINFFGEAPWQCLNPAASHYKKFVVTDFRSASRCRKGKPVGIFKCKCGFEYARSGPDTNPEDKFRIDKMIRFGVVWEAGLVKLWNNPALNLSEIARRLDVDPLTARRYAEKLKLSFDRGNNSYQRLTNNNRLSRSSESNYKTETDKAEWLALLNKLPHSSLKELRRQNSRLYFRLHANAAAWLKSNLPQRIMKKKVDTSSVDWTERDRFLVIKVKTVAIGLKEKAGRPKRITKTSIGKETGSLSLLLVKLEKLPNTAKVLETIIETSEEYAVRRIQWAAKTLRENYLRGCKKFCVNRNI